MNNNITEILNQAIAKSQILQRFRYGHNLLQSPVQINEIFSMIDTLLNDVIKAIGDVIPDINVAEYRDGNIDNGRVNLCWIELTSGYYGLILNTHLGTRFREFSSEDIQNLLLTGQVSSWYLISKIQNLSYLLSKHVDENVVAGLFRTLIIQIIERLYDEHEKDPKYHPAGQVSIDTLEALFTKIQIQNTSSIIETLEDNNTLGNTITWSESIITRSNDRICWQSASDFKLSPINSKSALDIIASKYLYTRADVEAFLESTYRRKLSNEIKYDEAGNVLNLNMPNEFCYLSYGEFNVPYYDLNYQVEKQLLGTIDIEYTNFETETVVPDAHSFVILKGKNDIAFMTVIKIDNDIVKRIKSIDVSKMRLAVSCTGKIQ